jgi:2-polyprenyl-3-methyl-5-hydroxy-6-metoxy-1,4-benzoquinol methylase
LKVTAVDNEKSPLRQFDKTLLENKNIEFISKNIEDYLLESDETFDLVLLMNVIAFIKKDIFLGDILQKITHKINKQ